MRISPYIPLVLAGALASSCSQPPKATAPPHSVPVQVLKLEYQTLPAVIEAPGIVQPRNRIVLSSQINGFVREVRAQAGESVNAGQMLLALDQRDSESQKAAAQASIEEAQAALEEGRRSAQAAVSLRTAARASSEMAQATFVRYQKLLETRSVAPQEFEEVRARRDASAAESAAKEMMVTAAEDRLRQIEARIRQADAQARRADVLMGWTLIRAPWPGKITQRPVDPGSAVFAGSPLVVMESTAKPQVLVDLPTAQAQHLRPGLEVKISGTDRAAGLRGRIVQIIPLSNTATHTVQFKVDLPDDFAVLSGEFVRVEIPAGSRQVLLVPRTAVRESGQLTGVFIADGSSIARYRLVKIAPFDEAHIELLAGVEPGERVISPVGNLVVDGIPLEIHP